MLRLIKKLDNFHKNIILVFLGTSLINIFNLFYQLLLAHRMSGADFAAFNSLLSIFLLISAPLATIQTGVAKYSAEFSAQNRADKARALLRGLGRKVLFPAVFTFLIFLLAASYVTDKLKIPSLNCGYILAALLALSWFMPVFSGALQGLELFNWLVSSALISGILKLGLAFIFIGLGFNICGALGAFLAANLIGIIIFIFPLRNFFSRGPVQEDINFKEFFSYLFPVAVSLFCFTALVNYDMVLVKYFFNPAEAGFYSLAQMVGKIFLFLPGAISLVMFPRSAGLNARNMDTRPALRRSLLYAAVLCIIANIVYNFFPVSVLKILTGKTFGESVILGRLFGLSMSFFSFSFILITYFLSLKDMRFIKYLILFTLLQFFAIILFHTNLLQVQLTLCINSILLFFIHLALSYKKRAIHA
ncbi:MAG: oligosaccharide flippase family protein [Candidatus Omnitrophica bacterium]|nr:oligosaccharide flippase family protein [Candidatus Omnitrophota bacterium]MDD5591982.1 oligosaccharide flippase family protein [Candidatus Omnitrophota bacterium]